MDNIIGRALLHKLNDKPSVFWDRVLGCFAYKKQRRMVTMVRDNDWSAVCGANGTGKDWNTGRIMLWWQSTRYPAKTIVIGPSHRQVEDVVWKEARSAYKAALIPLGGRMYESTRWEFDDNHFALGFATDDAINIQGFHSPNLLVIVTEAHNVEQSHIEAIKRLNPKRMILTGNPLVSSGEFFDAFHSRQDMYATLSISAFDSPNLTGERVVDGLVDAAQIERYRRDWGEDSALYISAVLGKFPKHGTSNVVPSDFIDDCQTPRFHAPDDLLPVELGVDVGAGGDETVIRERRGVLAGRTWRYSTPRWQTAVGHVLQAIRDTGATRAKIDVIGIGWGVVGRLQELHEEGKHSCQIIGVNVGSAPSDPVRFPKLRDQIWWEIGREKSQNKTWDLSRLDAKTIAQLVSPKYSLDSSARIKIEPKVETKKRLGRSPDDADALLLAFYEGGNEQPQQYPSGEMMEEGLVRESMWVGR